MFAQTPDLLVEQGDLSEVPGFGGSLILVEGRGVLHSLRDFGMGAVGGREPGNGEHGLVSVLVFAQELKGCIHRDHGARSLDLQVLSIAAEIGIVVEEVQPRKPLVESGPAGGSGAVRLDRSDVPFAEMSRYVTGLAQLLGYGLLVRTHIMSMVGDVGPERMPAGHHAGPGRRANRSACIETVEHDPGLGHLIEVRSLHERMPREPAISVAMVIRHDENDMRPLIGRNRGCEQAGQEEQAKAFGRGTIHDAAELKLPPVEPGSNRQSIQSPRA